MIADFPQNMEEFIDEPPTDYSLQYQESEDAEVNDSNNLDEAVKTYYTEGTPFDTPLISNAHSVSDLRPVEEPELPEVEPVKSGLETPASEVDDRPQVYATEGTPGCFSRADSPSPEEEEKGQLEAAEGPSEKAIITKANNPGGKSVSFLPEQTPLMFSPCSSFESLTSFDHQPIRSGYSSCDFSRATSGRVSPSDLPDSPCQSRPFSPKRKQVKATAAAFAKATTTSTAELEKAAEKKIIEEEILDIEEEFEVKTYDVEGTPAVASESEVTFSDDEPEVTKVNFVYHGYTMV